MAAEARTHENEREEWRQKHESQEEMLGGGDGNVGTNL